MIDKRPVLETERLLLRPFQIEDAAHIQRLAGDRSIASTTLNIPHPYEDGMAEEWIGTHKERYDQGESVILAIQLKEKALLIGAIGLEISRLHQRAELGYWIGKEYWGQGYCTEAARQVLRFGFGTLELDRICASHLTRNPASGKVMQKIGMLHEGNLRKHVLKWGIREDLDLYGILREEWAG